MSDCCNKRASKGKLGIACCKSGEPFGNLVLKSITSIFEEQNCNNGGALAISVKETHFPNTESKIEFMDSIRGMDLYIVQDVENKEYAPATFLEHIPAKYIADYVKEGMDPDALIAVKRPFSVPENVRVLLSGIDAARRSDVHYVTAVIPVFPYARQDKAISREGITAQRIAEELESHGANRVITLDLHNRAIAGYFRSIPCENLHASRVIMPYIKNVLKLDNFVIASPDEGGITRANYYAKSLGKKLAMGYKRRDYSQASVVEDFRMLGDVVKRQRNLEDQVSAIKDLVSVEILNPAETLQKITSVLELKAEGYDVIFIDDMIATAGSLKKAVQKVKNLGARDVWFAVALPLFTYPATQVIDELYAKGMIKGVIGTSAVYHDKDVFARLHPWYHEVPIERYFAQAIFNINHYETISDLVK